MINLITGVATAGIIVGTMSLIIVLSVFNGFETLISSLYSTFNPDIKVTAKYGKYFNDSLPALQSLHTIPGIHKSMYVLEENALVKHENKQYVATLKAVQPAYTSLERTKKMMVRGEPVLQNGNTNFAIVGLAIAYHLDVNTADVSHTNLSVYVPNISGGIGMQKPFHAKKVPLSGIFSIQQEIDNKYVIVPLRFLWDLTKKKHELSSIDIYLKDNSQLHAVKEKLKQQLGSDFEVKDHQEQEALLYKIMKSEKLAIFFILTFILIIAMFNIIGSISIIIIDKKKEIQQLWNLGANQQTIKVIFYMEGLLILLVGSIVGLILGVAICMIQENFGLIKLGEAGSFLINAYPVSLQLFDVILVFFTVIGIGFLAIIYPIHQIIKRYFSRL
ncbi:MAG: hypothetical protein CSA94_00265 [Bacteroidetes bacterium]|nr:MAG: hypothetical protein CSA94_00265 [Bacteroidota bacterium]